MPPPTGLATKSKASALSSTPPFASAKVGMMTLVDQGWIYLFDSCQR